MTDLRDFNLRNMISRADESVSVALPRPNDEKKKSMQKKELENYKKIIRTLNIKVTQPRLLILQALHSSQGHITAQELFEKVQKLDSSVGFATVFRMLKSLSEGRFVTELRLKGHSTRYEVSTALHHDHMTCQKCGLICEFENEQIEKLQREVAGNLGFLLTYHKLELFGLCPVCQKNP